VGGLAALVDWSISAADAIGKTADKIGVGVEALQELRYAAKASGVEQQTLDMALQRFARRAAEAAQGTGEAKDALAQMGIAPWSSSRRTRRLPTAWMWRSRGMQDAGVYDIDAFWSAGNPTRLTVPTGVSGVRLKGNIDWTFGGNP
jgi:hypothetical protein